MTKTSAHDQPRLNENPIVLVTVSGPDAPGITSEITGILAESKATVLDIGQAVIHGLLSLSILFQMHPEDTHEKATIKDLLFKATEMGLKLEFQVLDAKKFLGAKTTPRTHSYRYAITLIADQITAEALHHVTSILGKTGSNIDVIQRLSDEAFSCVELLISSRTPLDQGTVRKELLEIATEYSVDIALQSDGLFRKAKRLVVMDLDSTLIQNEVIDEFARHLGKYEEVSAITHDAMNGKIPFAEALQKRCAVLEGLRSEDIEKVYQRLKLTPGAKELVQILKKLGYKIAIISGGFSIVAEKLRQSLGIDYAYANTMIMKDGRFTGKIQPPIVDAQRKADLLETLAQQERIDLGQVIAIGDGANDLLMLEKAGLGIAFNAKPSVREQADLALNQPNLRAVFYLLGIPSQDLQELKLH